jgi:hypothetical protein
LSNSPLDHFGLCLSLPRLRTLTLSFWTTACGLAGSPLSIYQQSPLKSPRSILLIVCLLCTLPPWRCSPAQKAQPHRKGGPLHDLAVILSSSLLHLQALHTDDHRERVILTQSFF